MVGLLRYRPGTYVDTAFGVGVSDAHCLQCAVYGLALSSLHWFLRRFPSAHFFAIQACVVVIAGVVAAVVLTRKKKPVTSNRVAPMSVILANQGGGGAAEVFASNTGYDVGVQAEEDQAQVREKKADELQEKAEEKRDKEESASSSDSSSSSDPTKDGSGPRAKATSGRRLPEEMASSTKTGSA